MPESQASAPAFPPVLLGGRAPLAVPNQRPSAAFRDAAPRTAEIGCSMVCPWEVRSSCHLYARSREAPILSPREPSRLPAGAHQRESRSRQASWGGSGNLCDLSVLGGLSGETKEICGGNAGRKDRLGFLGQASDRNGAGTAWPQNC